MDEKYMERPPKFDKREYNKTHYRQFSASLKPELYERITGFCKEKEINKTEFMAQAIELMENKYRSDKK